MKNAIKIIIAVLILLVVAGAVFFIIRAVKPKEDKEKFYVSFTVGEEVIAKVPYYDEATKITVPPVPEKEGYAGSWEEYTLDTGNKIVNAIYSPIDYTVTFKANDSIICSTVYTVENKQVIAPTVPERYGYTGVWEDYTIDLGDKTINAVYTPINYVVTFKVEGETIVERTYNVERRTIEIPSFPTKTGYTGSWENYVLDRGDKAVNAIYTPINYTVTFKANDNTFATRTYTVENNEIEEPDVPRIDDYDGEWENYVLDSGNKIVNAVYTPKTYTLTFKADGNTVATKNYTVENRSVTSPTLPTKAGYTGRWETYTVDSGNKTVNAVYEVITYTISYVNPNYQSTSKMYYVFGSDSETRNCGAVNSVFPTSYTIESGDLTVGQIRNHFSCACGGGATFQFSGWYLDAEKTISFDGVIDGGTVGDIVIFCDIDLTGTHFY